MNRKNGITREDIPFFALALNDKYKYYNTEIDGAPIADYGQFAGDLGRPGDLVNGHVTTYRPDGRLTFDDVTFFAAKLGMSREALLREMNIPEPIVSSLVIGLYWVSSTRQRRQSTGPNRFN